MNWEANLAAIIKHTDANLQQQFRQFDELSADLGSFSDVRPPPTADAGSTGFASAFLRDTMATMRGEAPRATGSFAQHFRERQDRKRHEQQFENNRAAMDDGASDGDDVASEQPQYSRTRRRARHGNNAGLGFQMYSSPTYDMAQMMEQVRLSLKLEVDARAAVAERQLSALLQLCKASSEELDRLRIEVCAADRQLHTLDQVQSKMRQELTTQKDIAFHLQSMCGKDESWRMQAENQLLEMRQMVATIREQVNAVQSQVQEKLSRQELLVHFNAAIEPIKAQFQATLHHQSSQLAEITRGTSSSSLLLDALTQKVNRLQSEEITVLRSELQALKIHVSRIGVLDGRGGEENDDDEDDDKDQHRRPPRRSTKRQKERELAKQERDQQEADQRRFHDETLKKDIMEVLVPQAVLRLVNSETEKMLKPQLTELRESMAREASIAKQELQNLCRQVHDNAAACQRHASSNALEQQIKQSELQLKSEVSTLFRELREKQDQREVTLTSQFNIHLDSRLTAVHAKTSEVAKSADDGRVEARLGIASLQEEVRNTRHALEERLHTLNCDLRSKTAILTDDWAQKLRDLERKWGDTIDTATKQNTQNSLATTSALKEELTLRLDRVDSTVKDALETVNKLERNVVAIQEAPVIKMKPIEPVGEGDEPKSTRRASNASMNSLLSDTTQSQLTSIDALLQKMMLQMQLQLQQQQQLVMTQTTGMVQPIYSQPYWPSLAHTNGSLPLAPVVSSTVATIAQVSPAQRTSEDITRDHTADRSQEHGSARLAAMIADPVPACNLKSSIDGSTIDPRKLQEMKPDPLIDEIISRAVADELASPTEALQSQVSKSPTEIKSPEESSKEAENLPSAPPVATMLAPKPPLREVVDPIEKVQQTFASTVRGATTEAEMAKQRIEARRKQEQETRHQSHVNPPTPLLVRAASASSIVPPQTATTAETKPILPLTRSNSFTNPPSLPQSDTAPSGCSSTVHTISTMNKPPSTPLSALATGAASVSSPPTGPSSLPAQNITNSRSPPLRTDDQMQKHSTISSASLGPSVESKPSAPKSITLPSGPQVTHVLCDQCRLPVRSDLLSEHMQRQCIKRTVGCAKCEVKYPWHEVEAHQRGCQEGPASSISPEAPPTHLTTSISPVHSMSVSSKPSLTPDAPSSQPYQDKETERSPPQFKKCRHCSSDVEAAELFDHELKCDQMLKQCPHCLRRQKVAELQEHIENCDCRLVSCPNDCGGKFLQRGIDKHLATRCPKRSSTNSSLSPPKTSGSGPATAPPPPPIVSALKATTIVKDKVETTKVECKFCDEEIPASEIEDHENKCDWKPKRCQHCNMVIISRDLLRHESSCKTGTKTCPHCSEPMALSALPAHTNRCSKRPIKCIRCCQLFPADAIVAHSSSCRFNPPSLSSAATSSSIAGLTPSTSAPAKIPPPPPYPPTLSGGPERHSISPQPSIPQPSTLPPKATEESMDDRLARRNLALSQLTNQAVSVAPQASHLSGPNRTQSDVQAKPEVDDDSNRSIDDDEEEEEEEDNDDDHLTLAQVVAEWSVENVCLWLHEDVGVPDVVPRFQQQRCNGEMLLELTETDLINDYGIKNRIHRERILSAIDAIKTSDDFSDEEDEDEDVEDENEEEDEEDEDANVGHLEAVSNARVIQTTGQRASVPRLPLSEGAPNLFRRNSLPSPQGSPTRVAGAPPSSSSTLPSSSAMLRRINSALNVEFPSMNARSNK